MAWHFAVCKLDGTVCKDHTRSRASGSQVLPHREFRRFSQHPDTLHWSQLTGKLTLTKLFRSQCSSHVNDIESQHPDTLHWSQLTGKLALINLFLSWCSSNVYDIESQVPDALHCSQFTGQLTLTNLFRSWCSSNVNDIESQLIHSIDLLVGSVIPL